MYDTFILYDPGVIFLMINAPSSSVAAPRLVPDINTFAPIKVFPLRLSETTPSIVAL